MNLPYRVTCTDLVEKDGVLEQVVVFAISASFATVKEAGLYAASVDPNRKPTVAYTGSLVTEKNEGGWSCWDDDSYDGAPDGDNEIINCAKTEIEALFEFCEEFNRCTVYFNGVPCGGNPASVPDEAGSGWKRCDRCSML